ncbi:hypothetical protein GDO78_003711 [Eleutherodactylus coqui]|uniref:Cytochrome c oxidase subunit 8A, mitochondrial n=1 Tax=Eleutherodactylus coqui TaxID=57060 RepID=A0A8J6K125_ELECQ|nr:hypothetical protein GDO78_003711 [Eleutherodactylus coqui]
MSSAVTRLFRLPRVTRVVCRRGMSSNGTRTEMNARDTIIGLTAFMAIFLGPSGYILANLEEYKKRD